MLKTIGRRLLNIVIDLLCLPFLIIGFALTFIALSVVATVISILPSKTNFIEAVTLHRKRDKEIREIIIKEEEELEDFRKAAKSAK